MTDRLAARFCELVKRLEGYYDFQCEGGPLRNCVDWIELCAIVTDAPTWPTDLTLTHKNANQGGSMHCKECGQTVPKPELRVGDMVQTVTSYIGETAIGIVTDLSDKASSGTAMVAWLHSRPSLAWRRELEIIHGIVRIQSREA